MTDTDELRDLARAWPYIDMRMSKVAAAADTIDALRARVDHLDGEYAAVKANRDHAIEGFQAERVAREAAERAIADAPHALGCSWFYTAAHLSCTCWKAEYARASQPAPSSQPTCTCFPVLKHLHTTHYGATEPGSMLEPNPECPVHFPPAPSPVRIEDMTPGTKFLADCIDGPTYRFRWDGSALHVDLLLGWQEISPRVVVRSTVRDVQPAPTEGDAA